MKNSQIALFIVTLALCHRVVFANEADAPSAPLPLPTSPAEPPLNQRATADAWAAFRAGKYALAITKASECIDRYQPAADKIQSILKGDKAKLPTGAVSAAHRQQIDRYQILHDVAACLLIKGWAEERLGQKSEATNAYAKAKRYNYARATERPGDPVWSPAELASQNLARLSTK